MAVNIGKNGKGSFPARNSWGNQYRDNWDYYIMQKTLKQSIKELESLREEMNFHIPDSDAQIIDRLNKVIDNLVKLIK